MTIEEAIVHCRNKAADETANEQCRDEHAQLAIWLAELKELREERRSRWQLQN